MTNNQNNQQFFESLDIFRLLRLDHLSDQEKLDYTNEMVQMAFISLATDELPLYMSAQEINQFSQMVKTEETREAGIEFLKTKVSDFEELFKYKVLGLKKSLVKANVEERIDINKVEYENLRANAENQETLGKIVQNQKERTHLEKIARAIEQDNWQEVDSLMGI